MSDPEFERKRKEAMVVLNSLVDKMAQQRAARFINAAVEAERERCALLVLDLDCNFNDDLISANVAAAEIRKGGKP